MWGLGWPMITKKRKYVGLRTKGDRNNMISTFCKGAYQGNTRYCVPKATWTGGAYVLWSYVLHMRIVYIEIFQIIGPHPNQRV